MRRNRIEIAVFAAIAAVLGAVTSAPADPAGAAIEANNRAFIEAFLRGDAEALAGMYSAAAKVIAPGNEVAAGRPAIAAFWRRVLDGGAKGLELNTGAVESAGDLAYEDGTVKLVGADGKASVARYVVVWKREGERWKLHRDIWN
jgi:ketosteroid isomerase-like protein